VQFGNDDVASKVWVTARALLVGLFSVSDMGCLVLRHVTIESNMRWSVLVATMTGNRWPVKDSVGASPVYYFFEARRHSQSCLSLACVANCYRPVVVPNMIVFHNDIRLFVSVFDRFPTNERSSTFS
jgi:hypothetical protein